MVNLCVRILTFGKQMTKPIMDNVQKLREEGVAETYSTSNNKESSSNENQQQKQSQQQHHGAKRKKRRSAHNREAIRFLQRSVFLVILLDGFLALSDCNLYGTLFFYLTLSSTFEVKPENVLDTYCYHAPVGNAICQSYMTHLTGYTPVPTYLPLNQNTRNSGSNGNGGGYTFTNSNSTQTTFPRIDSGIRMTDEQSFQLFLLFNQSFYESPAKFSLKKNIDKNSKLTKLYNQLVFYLYEGGLKKVSGNFSGKLDSSKAFNISRIHLSMEPQIFDPLHQSIEVIQAGAPATSTDIPQVIAAKARLAFSRQAKRKQGPENKEPYPTIPKSKDSNIKHFTLDDGQTPYFKNKRWNNILQSKDFLRHRWKRSVPAFPNANVHEKPQILFPLPSVAPSLGVAGRKVSVREAKIIPSSFQQQNKHQPFTRVSNENNNIPRSNNSKNDSKIHIMGTVVTASGEAGRKGASLINPEGKSPQFHDHSADEEAAAGIHVNSINSENTTNEPSLQVALSGKQNADVSNAKKITQTPPFQSIRRASSAGQISSYKNLETIVGMAEANLIAFTDLINENEKSNSTVHTTNSSAHGLPGILSQASRKKNRKLKEFQELFTILERNPRHLMGLIESSIFNNWLCFSKAVRLTLEHPNVDLIESGWKCGDPKPAMLQARRGGIKGTEQQRNENLLLNMEMDIISHETFKKAERRRKAVEQIYHDYSNTMLADLAKFDDIQVSPKFENVYFIIKLYTFAWHFTICVILAHGTAWENSTSLNIWGLLNILTSLLHFMVDEWINATFQPVKTSAAIWFAVLYSVYKPVSILLVASLSSEITRYSRIKQKPGLCLKVKKILHQIKRPPNPSFMITDEMGTVRLITGERSYDCQACNSRAENADAEKAVETEGNRENIKDDLDELSNHTYVTVTKEGYISAITKLGNTVTFKTLAEMTDEESDYDDEGQPGDDDDDIIAYSDGEMEYADEEDVVDSAIDECERCCHKETELERVNPSNVHPGGKPKNSETVKGNLTNAKQSVDYDTSARSTCNPISREGDETSPLIVDGGNVHI